MLHSVQKVMCPRCLHFWIQSLTALLIKIDHQNLYLYEVVNRLAFKPLFPCAGQAEKPIGTETTGIHRRSQSLSSKALQIKGGNVTIAPLTKCFALFGFGWWRQVCVGKVLTVTGNMRDPVFHHLFGGFLATFLFGQGFHECRALRRIRIF